ncbi:MAG: orotate phosphoribosyltransferase [Bacteriovorax sp.]|nr:orotate phosphoribosyltransferase [Bacteriovorax sp.]
MKKSALAQRPSVMKSPMKMDIAKNLINLGAVKFSPQNPFTYASGLKGPIYCDNRLILSQVEFRDLVIASFIKVIEENKLRFDHLGGIATAGIPHAAFVADRMKRSMVYVRPKAKDHGGKNQVEGLYKAGDKVLLFEDLVNQGASLEDSMTGLNGAELSCDACLCVVDYEMIGAQERLRNLSIQLFALTDFTSLTMAAFELNLINQDGLNLLKEWHADPKAWSVKF